MDELDLSLSRFTDLEFVRSQKSSLLFNSPDNTKSAKIWNKHDLHFTPIMKETKRFQRNGSAMMATFRALWSAFAQYRTSDFTNLRKLKLISRLYKRSNGTL